MKKILLHATPIVKKLESATCAVSSAAMAIVPTLMTLADSKDGDGGKSMLATVLGLIGKLMYIPAIGFLAVGFYSYATSHAEGDGPAQNKAIQKISAAVIIGVVATLFTVAGTSGSTINNLIESMLK